MNSISNAILGKWSQPWFTPSLFYHVCTQMNKPKKRERNVVVTTSKQAWGGT
jgi:hypothetical protein